VRTNLTVEDLGDLLDKPLVAVLATMRMDGSVLLSPVYHEWRDGGFNIWVEQQNVEVRHLRRDPRATILVAESDPPLRAVEVRGRAFFIEQGVSETAFRIVTRYEGLPRTTDQKLGVLGAAPTGRCRLPHPLRIVPAGDGPVNPA
jgi:PPOX class probable F420-dependent enzyme